MTQSRDVSVHHNSKVDSKGVAEDDVGCFSANASQRSQFAHGLRNFPVELFHQSGATCLNIFGLATKEADAADLKFQFSQRSGGIIASRAVLFEEGRGDGVDLFIRALCREDGSN